MSEDIFRFFNKVSKICELELCCFHFRIEECDQCFSVFLLSESQPNCVHEVEKSIEYILNEKRTQIQHNSIVFLEMSSELVEY